jgi:hypothetical protein
VVFKLTAISFVMSLDPTRFKVWAAHRTCRGSGCPSIWRNKK